MLVAQTKSVHGNSNGPSYRHRLVLDTDLESKLEEMELSD